MWAGGWQVVGLGMCQKCHPTPSGWHGGVLDPAAQQAGTVDGQLGNLPRDGALDADPDTPLGDYMISYMYSLARSKVSAAIALRESNNTLTAGIAAFKKRRSVYLKKLNRKRKRDDDEAQT